MYSNKFYEENKTGEWDRSWSGIEYYKVEKVSKNVTFELRY